MIEVILGLLAGIVTLATLFIKFYMEQQRPEDREKDRILKNREQGDRTTEQIERRQLTEARTNIIDMVARIKAEKKVKDEKGN